MFQSKKSKTFSAKSDDHSYHRQHDANDPKTHHYFAVRPTQGLEMMMDGSRPENFSAQIFFGKYLQNGRTGSGEKRKSDYRQNRHRVGKKGHGRQSRRQSQDSRLAHIKSGRRNIEPQESQCSSHHYPAKSRQVYLILEISDSAVRRENGGENPAGKPVQTVYHPAGKNRRHHEHKKRDEKYSQNYFPEKRNINAVYSQFIVKPKRAHQTHQDDQRHSFGEAYPSAVVFSPSDHDKQIIGQADKRPGD